MHGGPKVHGGLSWLLMVVVAAAVVVVDASL